MSLAKVPVTLLVSYALKRCLTPPNPPPPKEERFRTNILERGWYLKLFGPVGNMEFLFGIWEAVGVLVWKYRSPRLAQTILSLPLFGSARPDRVKLSPSSALGAFLILSGTFLRLATFKYLGEFFRYEASIQKNHQLVTGGPYAYVRHPGYTALVTTFLGWVLWHGGEGSWLRESGVWKTLIGKIIVSGYFLAIPCGTLYLVLTRMKNEDEALRKRFGKQWEEWAQKVPYSVVPAVY